MVLVYLLICPAGGAVVADDLAAVDEAHLFQSVPHGGIAVPRVGLEIAAQVKAPAETVGGDAGIFPSPEEAAPQAVPAAPQRPRRPW